MQPQHVAALDRVLELTLLLNEDMNASFERDGLETSGLVVRRPHPTDRRATLVTFTDAGSRIAAEMAAARSSSQPGCSAG